ncbi:MAG: hypothetical protein CSA26_04690 [Desulfobacterales bacterium]|nr:MAG: hypothetical protein CSA26_04690 [Desulfobacterales bacterium]
MSNRKIPDASNINNRRIARLALAADREKRLPGCVTAEEMALFLDHRCGYEKEGKIRAHLASCDQCYREWLILSRFITQKKQKGRIISLFARRPFLTITGSSLALAASVTIFWMTPFQQQKDTYLISPEQAVQEKDKNGQNKLLLRRLDIEQDNAHFFSESATVAGSGLKEKVSDQKARYRKLPKPTSETISGHSDSSSSAPVAGNIDQSSKRDERVNSNRVEVAPDIPVSSYQQLRKKLISSCTGSKQKKSMQEWTEEAQRLIHSNLITNKEKHNILTLLNMIEAENHPGREEICAQILGHLEQTGK